MKASSSSSSRSQKTFDPTSRRRTCCCCRSSSSFADETFRTAALIKRKKTALAPARSLLSRFDVHQTEETGVEYTMNRPLILSLSSIALFSSRRCRFLTYPEGSSGQQRRSSSTTVPYFVNETSAGGIHYRLYTDRPGCLCNNSPQTTTTTNRRQKLMVSRSSEKPRRSLSFSSL